MPVDCTFLMGKFEAKLPGDLMYTRNHLWAQHVEGRLRFGFTAYAVRLMQDVYFLRWDVEVVAHGTHEATLTYRVEASSKVALPL